MRSKSTQKDGGKEGASVYELGFLILPSIPEDKLSSVAASIREIISKSGGQEIDAEEPIKHDLAYQMSKTIGSSRYVVDDAYIGWIKFEAPTESISEIKAGIDKIAEVLRFILIKADRETRFTFAKAMEKEMVDNSVENKDADGEVGAEKEGVHTTELSEEPVI